MCHRPPAQASLSCGSIRARAQLYIVSFHRLSSQTVCSVCPLALCAPSTIQQLALYVCEYPIVFPAVHTFIWAPIRLPSPHTYTYGRNARTPQTRAAFDLRRKGWSGRAGRDNGIAHWLIRFFSRDRWRNRLKVEASLARVLLSAHPFVWLIVMAARGSFFAGESFASAKIFRTVGLMRFEGLLFFACSSSLIANWLLRFFFLLFVDWFGRRRCGFFGCRSSRLIV